MTTTNKALVTLGMLAFATLLVILINVHAQIWKVLPILAMQDSSITAYVVLLSLTSTGYIALRVFRLTIEFGKSTNASQRTKRNPVSTEEAKTFASTLFQKKRKNKKRFTAKRRSKSRSPNYK